MSFFRKGRKKYDIGNNQAKLPAFKTILILHEFQVFDNLTLTVENGSHRGRTEINGSGRVMHF